MKKSLLALAVLGAFAGAASAQSSVTIYGIVDQGVAKMNDGASIGSFNGAGRRDSWTVQQGASSRLGFRGAEDLGGGLGAYFQLEHRFTPDTGTTNPAPAGAGAGQFWVARSVVGINGGFGAVQLGREYIPAFWPAVKTDPWGFDTLGQMGALYGMAGYANADLGLRNNNTVTYMLPRELGGFAGQVQVSAGEGARGALGRAMGGNVEYSAGPVYVGFAVDQTKNNGAGTDPRLWNLGGKFDFGVVKLHALIAQARSVADVKTKSGFVAVSAPMGQGEARLAAGRNDPDGPAKATKLSAAYFYALSKRTSLYTDVGTVKATDGTGLGLSRSTGVDVGIKHSF